MPGHMRAAIHSMRVRTSRLESQGLNDYYFPLPPEGYYTRCWHGRVCLSLCLSVGLSAHISRKPWGRTSPYFLYMLSVALVSSSGAEINCVICVLPVCGCRVIFSYNWPYGTSVVCIPKWQEDGVTAQSTALIPIKIFLNDKDQQVYSSWVALAHQGRSLLSTNDFVTVSGGWCVSDSKSNCDIFLACMKRFL